MKKPFQIGDRVVKNPETQTWLWNEFDSWGRGIGVGVILDPPFPLGAESVDVLWPGGRCFEAVSGLLLVSGPLADASGGRGRRVE